MHKLTYEMQIARAVAPATSNTTFTGIEVNATGYDRACYVINVGAMTNTATLDAYCTESATTGGSFANTSTSDALTQVADTGGAKLYIIDHPVNSAKPFLKLAMAAGTANVVASAICILYNGTRIKPPTQNATQTVVR